MQPTLEQGHIEILKTIFQEVPFNRALGLKCLSVSHLEATIQFVRSDEHVGNFLHDILHGGVISSILDSAGGIVAMASILHRHPNASQAELAELIGKCSTIDLHINYLRPGRGDSFIAKAYMVRSGRKIAFTRIEFFAEDQELIATGTATFLC